MKRFRASSARWAFAVSLPFITLVLSGCELPRITITPSQNLIDGQSITLSLEHFGPASYVRFYQCPADAPDNECTFLGQGTTTSAGTLSTELSVNARLAVVGTVDCRTQPCTLVALGKGCTVEGGCYKPTPIEGESAKPPGPTAGEPKEYRAQTALAFDPHGPLRPSGFALSRAAAFDEVDVVEGTVPEFLQISQCPLSALNSTRCRDTASAGPAGTLSIEVVARYQAGSEIVDCRAEACALFLVSRSGVYDHIAIAFAPAKPVQKYVDRLFANVKVTRDVLFRSTVDAQGSPVDLYMDVFEPVEPTPLTAASPPAPRPAVLWMHGGYFIFGERGSMESFAEDSARRGYVGITLEYRLRPWCSTADLVCQGEAGYDAYDDAIAAIKFLTVDPTNRFRVDPARIFTGGYSAGAVTSINVAYLPGTRGPATSPVLGAVAIAGVGFGGYAAGDPHTLLFHGKSDTVVPFAWGQSTCDAANAAGSSCTLIPYTGYDHYITWAFFDHITRESAAFFAERMASP